MGWAALLALVGSGNRGDWWLEFRYSGKWRATVIHLAAKRSRSTDEKDDPLGVLAAS